MKPSYRHFLKAAFPNIIILPAMVQLASAAIILPDSFGNVLVTPTQSGPNNIQTGFFPVAGPHEIRVDTGATVNPGSGDAIEVQVFNASGATYTINNNGTLSALGGAPGQHGIDTIDIGGATPSITVNNNGLISGFSAIRANNTLFLTNNGTLQGIGFSDGAVFAKNGATITNDNGASIIGNVHGIQSELATGVLLIQNDSSITGTNFDGITSPGIVRLTNSYQQTLGGESTVTGNRNGVVGLGINSIITNSGAITGTTGDGVQVGANGVVSNLVSFDGNFPFGPIFGGQINGGVNGVVAGSGLVLTNEYMGLIAGGSADGIHAGANATIVNEFGASIIGSGDDGIEAAAGASITNHGTITGRFGIYLPNGSATIDNTGTISGSTDGILIVGSPGVTITNTGLITSPATAIGGNAGNEILNFNLNSRVVGNIKGGGGSDTLNFDGGLTSPFSLDNSVSGDVVQFTNINKTGSGVARIGLPGDPLYTVTSDNITISGGGLYINANIDGNTLPQSAIIAGGTALGGTGTWDANIAITTGGISAGAIPIDLDVNPRNAVGLLALTGDVSHSLGTFIGFDVNPNSLLVNGVNSDLIRQTGVGNTYALNATGIRISTTDNNQIIRNGIYTVVDSAEVIAGLPGNVSVQFNPNVIAGDTGFIGSEVDFSAATAYNNNNTVLANYFTEAIKSLDQTDLLLVVQHDFAGLPGLTANQSNLGAALDASISSQNALTQDFIGALDNSDLTTVQDTLASLVPDVLLDAASALVGSNYRVHRLVQDHLAMTRSSAKTVVETPATTDAKGATIPAQTTSSGRGMGNVWGTFSYDWKDSDFGNSNFKGEDESFTAGIDYRIAPDWLVGLLIDGSQGDYDYTGGSSDVDSFRIGIYATYGQATGIYADFYAGYGNHNLDVSRSLGGILHGNSNSTADANSFQTMLTVGYAMVSDNVKHGPFAGLEYQTINVDGYTQSGVFPISVSSFDVDSFRGLIGYRAEATYGQFTPYASVAYAHEFMDGTISTRATLPSGASFGVNAGGLGSAILISVGAGYAITPKLGLNVGYHGEIAVSGDGIDSNGGSIGLNYAF